MIKGIYLSARSLQSYNRNMEIISNNLANINTLGFKKQGLFSEILTSSGTPQIREYSDKTQGEIYGTSNLLDLAIDGDGMFVLKSDSGFEFSRDGRFHISDDGYLVNQQGQHVLGRNGEINISDFTLTEDNTINISKDGTISIGSQNIDTLMIAKIDGSEYEKRRMGLNFDPAQNIDDLADQGSYQILQGYLEESNVNPILEMENMIKVSKDYESAYKMITYLDGSLEKTNDIGKI